MAKKPKGYYSPEAIQARQAKAREAYLAPLENIVKEKEQTQTQPQNQPQNISSVGIAARSLPKVTTPFEPTPPNGDIGWDYKTATTDMQGKPLERRSFAGVDLQPIGFDPNGNPYFGAGGVAWLKKWAYKLSEESATKAETEEAWNQYKETSAEYSKRFVGQFTGDTYSAASNASLFLQGAKELFDATTKTLEGISVSGGNAATGGFKSPVTAALRAVNAAVGMTLEAFQFVSEVPERAMGAQQAMREYANRTGSVLPSLTFDPVDDEYYQQVLSDPKLKSMYAPDNGFKANKDAADVLSRLITPLLSGYDALRFWTSPGSVDEKLRAIQNGWTEGRMLYTELLKDTVKADYEARVKAGEDPVLLTMEMEDPWIEAGGEMLLDPLNALGLLGKAKKAGDTLLEAGRVVEQSGLLKNQEAIDLIKTIPKLSDPGEGAKVTQNLVEVIKTEATTQARRIAQANDYKLFSYTPSANKIKTRKVVGNFVSAVTQAFRNTGRSADDVLDYLNAVRKLSSNDDAQIIEGIAAISKTPLQTMAYNDAAFETGYMLNKILEDGDFINQMQKQSGDFSELAKWVDTKLEKATDYAFPSISEMSRASEKVSELEKLGQVPDAKTLSFAERFKELQKTNPGRIKFAQAQDFIDRLVKPINGFLANSYFSLSYGYAFRNAVQNMFTLWVDDGLMFTKEAAINFTKEGVKTPALDKFIVEQFGEIPQALRGKTMTQSMTGGSLWNEFFDKLNRMGYSPAALADAAEVYAGKMIYVKKYRQTMDKVADFGGMLPRLEEWQKAGFTTAQAQDFKDLFRANNYNAEQAVTAFAKKYGKGTVDKARVLDWVNAEAKAGLQQFENDWDDIVNFVNDENKTLPEIENYLEGLKAKVKSKAQKTSNDIPRLDDRDPMVKILVEDKEKAGKFFNQDVDNQFTSMKIQANRAVSEFEDALYRAVYELGKDPSEKAAQLAEDIMQARSGFQREVEDNIRLIDQTREWVIDRRNRALAKEDPNLLWDEAVMGPKPKTGIITKDSFLKALWEDYYFPKRRGIWQNYYENKFSKYMEFAKAKPELSTLFEKANYENIKFQQYADYVFSGGKIKAQVPQIVPAALGEAGNANNVRSLANAYGVTVPSAYTTPDNYILNVVNKYGSTQYPRLEDVPLDVAEKVFASKSGKPNMKYIVTEAADEVAQYKLNETAQGMDVPAPHDPATSPGAHVFAENEQGYINAINHIRDGIRERWGLREAVGTFDPRTIMPDLVERVTFAKSKAQVVAEKYRDFALLPYGETKNMDLAMSLVYPYQFWYSRSYKNWMQRAFMTNPEIISRYANLKEAMAKEQKDLPDWWKSQLNITPGLRLLGADVDHPVYINLEATLFPLYGLTGTDFNDPQKRINWWTATLDDMGKFGPSVWAPLQIATALKLAIDGENEAAARWGGRLIPQTASIKAVSSFFGNPIELDPSVNLFSLLNGGELGKATDPYEEKRIGRALSKMAEEGVPEEALIEAARTQTGPLWEEAYRRAVQERAPGQLASFLFGVGFKGRTEQDKEIDQFYADYFRMQNLRDAGYLTKNEYAQSFNEMRERYPFMDILLLSRRTGESKDAAYAYNVIGRIPPGASTEILKAAGIDPETANKFYEAGGKFENMTETEKQRFMAGIVDLGAMLSIPSNTTREQWTAVRAQYSQITELQKQTFGDDILDRIDYYYSLKTEQEKLLFREANPEVIDAMNFRTQMIASDPNILPYYGGIETLERYYNNVMYDKLEKAYGDKIFDLEEQYYNLFDAKDRKTFKAQHPELDKYFDERSKMKEEILFQLTKFGNLLPPMPEVQDVQPQNTTQEAIMEAAAPPPQISFDEWQGILGTEVADQVMEYANGGDQPSYYARQELEYQAKQLGMSYPELLRLVMSSINVVNYP